MRSLALLPARSLALLPVRSLALRAVESERVSSAGQLTAAAEPTGNTVRREAILAKGRQLEESKPAGGACIAASKADSRDTIAASKAPLV